MKTRASKGFFFVLISFLLVMYIFLYLTAWINAAEIAERTSSERFRAANVEGIIAQLTEEKFNRFFTVSGYYALFRINEHAGDMRYPMKYNESDDTYYLRDAFASLVENGTTSGDFEGAELEYTGSEAGTYTFQGWLRNLNNTLSYAGLVIKEFNMSNRTFTQVSPLMFNATMRLSILVEDNVHTISIRKNFTLKQEFNLTGFIEPMARRETQRIFGANAAVERQMFYSDAAPEELAPVLVVSGEEGQGFFYGPMISTEDVSASKPAADRSSYILVGEYNNIINTPNYRQFGAYIITSSPSPGNLSDTNCPASQEGTFMAIKYVGAKCQAEVIPGTETSSPFAVFPGFDLENFSGPGTGGAFHNALIIANHSPSEVSARVELKLEPPGAYDIEKLRDATVCTHYLRSSRGPSYAQRLSRNAPFLQSSSFGMESLLVGTWAGGKELPEYENYSQVDFEFFRKIDATNVRGMPGCKNQPMCSTPVGENAPLGHFGLSDDSLLAYGIEGDNDISCGDGRAGCEQ